jgi:hypothetical protein
MYRFSEINRFAGFGFVPPVDIRVQAAAVLGILFPGIVFEVIVF